MTEILWEDASKVLCSSMRQYIFSIKKPARSGFMLCPLIQTGPPTAADKEPRSFTERQATDELQEEPQTHAIRASCLWGFYDVCVHVSLQSVPGRGAKDVVAMVTSNGSQVLKS